MAVRSEHTPPVPRWVNKVEPQSPSYEDEGGGALPPCYSKLLKADLLPGTFVLLAEDRVNACDRSQATVAGIVKPVDSSVEPFQIQVNIFRIICEVGGSDEGTLKPQGIVENHLQHLPEIAQTSALHKIPMGDVKNLTFVFTEASLHDGGNLFLICQGMANAFLLRFRLERSDDAKDGEDDAQMLLMEMSSFSLKLQGFKIL